MAESRDLPGWPKKKLVTQFAGSIAPGQLAAPLRRRRPQPHRRLPGHLQPQDGQVLFGVGVDGRNIGVVDVPLRDAQNSAPAASLNVVSPLPHSFSRTFNSSSLLSSHTACSACASSPALKFSYTVMRSL